MTGEHHVKKSWFNLAAGLALLAGQGLVLAQDAAAPAAPEAVAPEPTPAPVPAQGLKPIPDVMESTALGFRRVNSARSFENAERTMVRLVRDGRIVQAHRVGVGGVAQMSEVSPGAYSVFATGSEGFAAFGVYLGDGAFSGTSSVGLVPQVDMGPVMSAIQTYTRSSAGAAAGAAVGKDLDRITEHGDFELHADGSVKGQVVWAGPRAELKTSLPGMHVAFVQDGQVVATAVTNESGEFTLPGIVPGVYSMVVAGHQGFAAFAVGAVRPVEQAQARTRRFEFVAAAVQTPVVTVCPVPTSDFALLNQLAANNGQRAPAPAPMAGGGGFGGGGAAGGGGGGGFGGGLLGAAAAAGAGAAIGAAVANNNDNPATP